MGNLGSAKGTGLVRGLTHEGGPQAPVEASLTRNVKFGVVSDSRARVLRGPILAHATHSRAAALIPWWGCCRAPRVSASTRRAHSAEWKLCYRVSRAAEWLAGRRRAPHSQPRPRRALHLHPTSCKYRAWFLLVLGWRVMVLRNLLQPPQLLLQPQGLCTSVPPPLRDGLRENHPVVPRRLAPAR